MQPQFIVMHNSRKAQRTTTKTTFETFFFFFQREKCHVIVTSFQPFPLSFHIIHNRTPLLKNKLVETVQCSSSEKKSGFLKEKKKTLQKWCLCIEICLQKEAAKIAQLALYSPRFYPLSNYRLILHIKLHCHTVNENK